MKKMTATLALIALTLIPMTAEAGDGRKAEEIRLQAELQAPISAGDVSGKVEFRDRGRRQFSVEIEGFVPGDRYDVMIGGAVVGTLVVDAFGIGEIGFDDEAQADDVDKPFSANFPQIDGGEAVQVGPLSGTLQAR